MSELTMEILARRLDRAERENRRLKQAGAVAMAVIAAVGLMGQARVAKVAKVIEAEKFIVQDKNHKTRAELAVEDDGLVALNLFDTSRTRRVVLAVPPEGRGRLLFFDKAGKVIWGAPRLRLQRREVK